MIRQLLPVSLIFFLSAAVAGKAPPKVSIDKDACPFECCTYREWSVEKDTDIFDKVGGTKKLGRAIKGTKVTALTGEVHTVPLKIRGEDGNEFYLLTYQGEGLWKVWVNGGVKEEVEQTWVETKRPNSTWWVKIRLKNDTSGWTKESENFGNMDSCG